MNKLRISISIFLISMMLAIITAISDITGISNIIGVNFVNPNFVLDYNYTLCIIVALLVIALTSFLFIIFFIEKEILKNKRLE